MEDASAICWRFASCSFLADDRFGLPLRVCIGHRAKGLGTRRQTGSRDIARRTVSFEFRRSTPHAGQPRSLQSIPGAAPSRTDGGSALLQPLRNCSWQCPEEKQATARRRDPVRITGKSVTSRSATNVAFENRCCKYRLSDDRGAGQDGSGVGGSSRAGDGAQSWSVRRHAVWLRPMAPLPHGRLAGPFSIQCATCDPSANLVARARATSLNIR